MGLNSINFIMGERIELILKHKSNISIRKDNYSIYIEHQTSLGIGFVHLLSEIKNSYKISIEE